MKKGSNVLEYAILAVVVGLVFGFSIFKLMISDDGSNRLRSLFSQSNQALDSGSGLTIDVDPITD